MIILGIDPGLNRTGFGFLRESGNGGGLELIGAGDICPPRGKPMPERLGFLREALLREMERHNPAVAVLEKIFIHHGHVTTAARMAHARGAVCLAVHERGIPLIEYTPTRVKHAVTGRGNATKQQVAMMVEHWLGRRDPDWSLDASDALGLAIAHAHIRHAPAGAEARV